MKQFTITKFVGLHVAENSTIVPDGALERAENVVINQDNLLQKRRGLKAWHVFPSTQFISTLFSFENHIFCLSQNKLYRFNNTITTASCTWIDGSKTITVAATSHGITDKDFIADFYIDNTSTKMTDWDNRQTDFYGSHETTVIPPTLPALESSVFTIESTNPPTATNATAVPCYFRKYAQVGGVTISLSDTARIAYSNGNAYFTSDNGVIKLEDELLPTLEAGIPPALDIISLTLSQTSDSKNTGYLKTASATGVFSKVAYRVLFGRKDANENIVIGAPSDYLQTENNKLISSTAAVYNAGPTTLTVTSAGHNLVANDLVYVYSSNDVLVTLGTVFSVTSVAGNDYVLTSSTLSTTTSLVVQTIKCVSVVFTIPSEINSVEYIYRIYRTTQGASLNDDYKLIEEKNITTAQLALGYVTYLDEVYDELVTGAFLYTNSNVEGDLQANDRPPICKDIALFKNRLFYGNCKQYPIYAMNLLSADGITIGSYLRIADSTYRFVVYPSTNFPSVTVATSRAANVLTVTSAAHGMLAGEQIYLASQDTGTNLVPIVGAYTISNIAAGSFDITLVGTFTGTITQITYNKKWIVKVPTSVGVTVSESINQTARNIVYVINQDDSSLIYAKYISSITDIPGKLAFFTKNFTNDFYIYGSDTSTVDAFSPNITKYTFPVVPTITSTDVKSNTVNLPNAVYVSKPDEPEAVPLTNFLNIGSRDKAIIRIAALRDSLIILKEDGIYRLNGDTYNNFSATLLDGTVIIKSANSLAILNNSVYCLSNQGIVQITDSSVRVISRTIEPLINSIIGDTNLSATTSGIAYESERTYMLSCKSPNTNLSIADNTYVYNYLTDGITTASEGGSVFKTALLSNKEDILYTIDSGDTNNLYRERKDQKKTDYLSDEFCVQADASIICSAFVSDNSASIQITSKVPHNLLKGTRITISKCPVDIYPLFTGGITDIEGIRTITTVIDDYSFCFDAKTISIGSVYSYLHYQNGVSEYIASAVVPANSNVVTVTTNNPHGFINSQTIKIDAYTFALLGVIPTSVYITYISPISFSFKVNNATALGIHIQENATVTISDKNRNYNYLTVTVAGVQPQEGDGLISSNNLYPIDAVYYFSPNKYVVYTAAKYSGLSTDLVFLGSGIRSIIRFSPVTLEQPNELKYFAEFSATFKNNSSFTKATINFANDFVYSTNSTFWDLKVGSDKSLISFGGWGQLEWGEFAWGGEYSVNRDFLTRPAVVLRTYVPKDVFVGTFIQPIIYHNKAGESIDLQSISLFSQPVTTRISR